MKLIDGQSLDACLEQYQDNPKGIAALLAQVARAVHHAHQRGILHRDLKPGNILIDADGRPHVTDFGLAKKIEDDKRFTQTGAIVGTPSYMPPEQARAEKSLTMATDVYSLGAVLYEMLTGKPPFVAETPINVILQILEADPEPPRVHNPKVDLDLATICLKCLAKEPEKRYESAAALADDMDRYVRDEPIYARPVTPWERSAKWLKRQKGTAALAGIAIVASAAAIAAILGAEAVLIVGLVALLWVGLLLYVFHRQAQRVGLKDQLPSNKEWRRRFRRRTIQFFLLVVLPVPLLIILSIQFPAYRTLFFALFMIGQISFVLLPLAERLHCRDSTEKPLESQHGQSKLPKFWWVVAGFCVLGIVTAASLGRSYAEVTAIPFSFDSFLIAALIGAALGAIVGAAMKTFEKQYAGYLIIFLLLAGLWKLRIFPEHGPMLIFQWSWWLLAINMIVFVLILAFGIRLRKHYDRDCATTKTKIMGLVTICWLPVFVEVLYVFTLALGRIGLMLGGRLSMFWAENIGALFGGLLPGVAVVHFTMGPVRTSLRPSLMCLSLVSAGLLWLVLGGTPQLLALGQFQLGTQIHALAIAPDNVLFLSVAEDVKLWNGKADWRRLSWEKSKVAVRSAAFSPDGKVVVTTGPKIQFWETVSGKSLHLLGRPNPWGGSIAFSQDGIHLLSGGVRMVSVWDLPKGKEHIRLKGHRASLKAVAFLPDSRRCVSCSEDWSLRVWDLDAQTGKITVDITNRAGKFTSMALSPKGTRVATGHTDWSIRVWHLSTGREIRRLEGHRGSITAVCWSKDGRWIVSASKDGTVRCWDSPTGKEQGIFFGHANYRRSPAVLALALSPNSRFGLSGDANGRICKWQLPE